MGSGWSRERGTSHHHQLAPLAIDQGQARQTLEGVLPSSCRTTDRAGAAVLRNLTLSIGKALHVGVELGQQFESCFEFVVTHGFLIKEP